MLGWQPEHLHGWYWEELVHPADRERVGEILSRVRHDRDCERDVEVRLAVQTGGYRLTSWTFVAGAGPDSILGLGHDRTDPPDAGSRANTPIVLERRNAQLAARVNELEERYEAVERFAGTAAHQLAEPLIIAESSAILVAEELGADLDPLLRGRLDAIGRGAARARRLMDALLADARGRPLELRTVDVSDGRRGDAGEPRASGRGAQRVDRGRAAAGGPWRARAALGRGREPRCRTRSSTGRAQTAVW